jgi:dienelactone hydrolase
MKRIGWVLTCLLFLAPTAFPAANASLNIRGKLQLLELYGQRGGTPVVLSSGDLGWAGLAVHVADLLASHGYFVVGFNSKVYLASFTTRYSGLRPQDVLGDYRKLVEFASQGSSNKPVLAGVSEGAGLSVLAATDPETKTRVLGVLGLGLPDQNELGWRWQDFTIWFTKKSPDEPSFRVTDIIAKVSPVPLAEIHSTNDEFLPLEKARALLNRAGPPRKMWVVEAANHRFSNNREELDLRIQEALAWMKAPQ